eukprot:GHVR01180895.1.p2 GENE.GHVR01180895.1~~GHVR01180895.1.p2  ORF type:complete len:105 (-),score=17.35 GHVR01180895.1:213-527(-)
MVKFNVPDGDLEKIMSTLENVAERYEVTTPSLTPTYTHVLPTSTHLPMKLESAAAAPTFNRPSSHSRGQESQRGGQKKGPDGMRKQLSGCALRADVSGVGAQGC